MTCERPSDTMACGIGRLVRRRLYTTAIASAVILHCGLMVFAVSLEAYIVAPATATKGSGTTLQTHVRGGLWARQLRLESSRWSSDRRGYPTSGEGVSRKRLTSLRSNAGAAQKEARATCVQVTAGAADSAKTTNKSKATVKVRQARKADYEGVAKLRMVIVPMGMDGATGFMGSKVIVDDPVEAKRRRLMSKVADLINGDTVALIALEGNKSNIVGAVDCSIQHTLKLGPINREGEGRSGPSRRGHYEVARDPRNGAGSAPPRPRLFLENLFVLPEHRRRGIARKLVKGAEEFAKSKGAKTICMEVARSNASALELYRSCGFEEGAASTATASGDSIGGVLMKALGMGNTYMSKDL